MIAMEYAPGVVCHVVVNRLPFYFFSYYTISGVPTVHWVCNGGICCVSDVPGRHKLHLWVSYQVSVEMMAGLFSFVCVCVG